MSGSRLFDLAIEAGDQDAAADLVNEIRKVEGDKGTPGGSRRRLS